MLHRPFRFTIHDAMPLWSSREEGSRQIPRPFNWHTALNAIPDFISFNPWIWFNMPHELHQPKRIFTVVPECCFRPYDYYSDWLLAFALPEINKEFVWLKLLLNVFQQFPAMKICKKIEEGILYFSTMFIQIKKKRAAWNSSNANLSKIFLVKLSWSSIGLKFSSSIRIKLLLGKICPIQ